MGPTCAGKSKLIQRLIEIAPDKVFPVEVGKMLRAKHGEDYFKGQAAPQHTQGEAWQMYLTGVEEGIAKKRGLIVVDGQPRDVQQAKDIIGRWRHPHRASFVLVHADHAERERRAAKDRCDSKANMDLAFARLTNDYRNCYVVMVELLRDNECIRVFDTTSMVDSHAFAEQVLQEYCE